MRVNALIDVLWSNEMSYVLFLFFVNQVVLEICTPLFWELAKMLLKQTLVTSLLLLLVGMFPLHLCLLSSSPVSFVLELCVFSCFTKVQGNMCEKFDHALFRFQIHWSCLNSSKVIIQWQSFVIIDDQLSYFFRSSNL